MKKRLLVLLTMLMVLLTACGGNAPDATTVPVVDNSAYETQVAELQNQLETALAQPDPTDVPATEVPTVVEPTLEPTEIPEPTETPKPDAYQCSSLKISTAVFQKAYTKTGKLKVNAVGNLVLKPLPKSDIRALANVTRWDWPNYQNLRNIGRYQAGDVVCFNDNVIQVDHMRVYIIWDGPVAGYYIPILAILGE